MNHRHAVRTAAVAALGLLLAVTLTPSASASPATSPPAVSPAAPPAVSPPAVSPAAPPAVSPPVSPAVSPAAATAAESAALQRDLGLSAAAAQQRLDRDHTAAATDAALRSQLGAAHQGSWIDRSTGRLVVRTSDPSSESAIRAAGAQPVLASTTKNPKRGKDKLDKAAKKAATSVGAWYVDDMSATVVVESTNVADALAFATAAGTTTQDAVQVKQVTQAPQLFANLAGGQLITASGDRCSIGFSARSATTSYVITAGHCTKRRPGTWAGYNGVAIGPVTSAAFPTDDFGSIKVNSITTWVPTSHCGLGRAPGFARGAGSRGVVRNVWGYRSG